MLPSTTRSVFLLVIMGLSCATPIPSTARDSDPDRSFGAAGRVVMPFPGGLSIVERFADVKLLQDQKLLVSATVATGGPADSDMGVMRLNANGSLDTTFGVGGARVVGFDRPGSSNSDIVRGMDVDANGRIVLFGEAAGGVGGIDMAVVRLTADGSLDNSFGSGGKATVAFDLGSTPARRGDQATKGIVLANGSIVVVGLASTAAGSVMAIARLTPGGLLDTAFDGDGKVTLSFGGGLADTALAYSVLAAADGQRIYAVGGAAVSGNYDFAIARLLGNGSLDTTFGGDGMVTFGFDIAGTLADVATGMVVLPDGRFLLCGAALVASPYNSDFACVRLLASGAFDSGFYPALVPFDLDSNKTDDAYATRLDAQGRILMAGSASISNPWQKMAVARLLASGQVDPSFGNDGRITFDGGSGSLSAEAGSLLVQPDGKIVVAGSTTLGTGNSYVQVVRMIGDTVFGSDFEVSMQ
ncbi:MAG TPA: hypothetical protein PKC03_17665 [Dokdonella sp.]|nr:hypothetical protein [Dokdonella sp.]